MKSLILHVGPPKCGSSSVQRFFKNHKKPFVEKSQFVRLDGSTVQQLEQGKLTTEIRKALKLKGHVILSHEALFIKPEALRTIVKLATERVPEIRLIGYSRRSSSFMLSAYHQWGFRNPKVVQPVNQVLRENDIDPSQFLGFERQLIASIIKDFDFGSTPVMDWNKSYGHLEDLLSFAPVKMKVGFLPVPGSAPNLILDFSRKAGLSLKKRYHQVKLQSNPGFNSHLTEFVNNAVVQQREVPGPHDDNDFFHQVSAFLPSPLEVSPSFTELLKNYIDTYFYPSHQEFCRKYQLNTDYFKVSGNPSKELVLEAIQKEMQTRLKEHRMTHVYREVMAITMEAFYKYARQRPFPKSV